MLDFFTYGAFSTGENEINWRNHFRCLQKILRASEVVAFLKKISSEEAEPVRRVFSKNPLKDAHPAAIYIESLVDRQGELLFFHGGEDSYVADEWGRRKLEFAIFQEIQMDKT